MSEVGMEGMSKSEIERSYTSKETSGLKFDQNAFTHYFSDAEVEFIGDLPQVVKSTIEEDENLADYLDNKFWAIKHKDKSSTFFTETGNEHYYDIPLIDVDELGNYQGWAGIGERKNLSVPNPDHIIGPSVGYTYTDKQHRGQGLGTRRLYMMNALSQAFFGKPLNSDSSISEAEERIWENLCDKGKAKETPQGYQFLPDAKQD